MPDEMAIQETNECIVDHNGTLEYGVVESVGAPGPDPAAERPPKILRRATLQDQAKEKESILMSKMAAESCVKQLEKHNLQVQLVRVDYSFDRSVLKVLFTSEERIDYRQMIKALSAELKARIDMQQIGVRDEAGIIGGVATCGRKLCCCSWLSKFESVNVKMAKTQRLSINPAAISGMCSRLKCCLRYEHEAYRELAEVVPREGSKVACPQGTGCVVDRNLLRQRVKVRADDGKYFECPAAEARRI